MTWIAIGIWTVFALLLAGGIAACWYWLREANRWWTRYEEMFIGKPEDQQ